MLAIRMQRTGRKGHAQFRVIVQDSHRSPTSGKIVAALGNYDPHTKEATLNSEKASFYLEHGAQPSDRVASLFKSQKIKLPSWVEAPTKLKRTTRNPEKLRKNQPKAEKPAEEPAVIPAPAEEVPAEQPTPKEKPAEMEPATPAVEETAPAQEPAVEETPAPAEEAPAQEPTEEKPAE